MKLNVALNRFPSFPAAPEGLAPERAQVTITDGIDAAQAAADSARDGVPAIGFCELYFQSAYDRTVVPDDREVMSVFCQFVPYELAGGDWDSRRDEIAGMALDAIERRAPDLRDCIEEIQVMGPPDIEARIGLTGGHIFQGQALAEPDVGPAARGAHADRRPLSLRRRDPPRRLGDRPQRPHRGRRGAGRRCRTCFQVDVPPTAQP